MAGLTVGHVYTIRVLDGFLEMNVASPRRPIFSEPDGLCEVPAVSTTSRLAHVGIAIRVNRSANLAVVLLGSQHPRQPHRFVPWLGTEGLMNQTPQRLVPSPPRAFLDYPGYINFTHALLVKVVGPSDLVNPNTQPGSPILRELSDWYDDLSDVITVPPEGIELCKRLHYDYWEGVRYGDPSGDDPSAGDNISSVSSEANNTHNFARRVAAFFHRQEVETTQLQLLDEEFDLVEIVEDEEVYITKELPPDAAGRPDCRYGYECRTQHNEAHSRKLNHVCEPSWPSFRLSTAIEM